MMMLRQCVSYLLLKSLVGGSPTVIFVGILLMAYENTLVIILPEFWERQVDCNRDLFWFPLLLIITE